jgi:hypothetical protein
MTKKSALRTMAIGLAITTAASGLTGMAGATAPNTSGDVQESARRGTVSGALVMGAVVKSDGSLDRSTTSGITSAGARKGRYVVHFPIDVKGCTYVATIGKTNSFGVAHPGAITTAGRFHDPSAVFVGTFNRRGDGADRPFHLQVACSVST